MASNRMLYFIRSSGADRNALKKALGWLLEMGDRGFLAVPSYRALDGPIGEELGKAVVYELKSKGTATIMGKQITVITKTTAVLDAKGAPLVAIYPYGHFLDSLDSIHNVSSILILPWSMQEIDTWTKAWGAKELGGKRVKAGTSESGSLVAIEALKEICGKANPASGIESPAVRDAFVQAFVLLKEAGEVFIPSDLKIWLIANQGWRAILAEEVAETAAEVLLGRMVAQGKPIWPDGQVEAWRARVSSSAKP
jgi:hypothetical protein